MRTKFTPAFIKSAKAEPGAERSFYWDEKLSRFGLMVTANGHRSFVLQYRNAKGESQRMKLSDVDDLSLNEARREAEKHIGEVAKGNDPLSERQEARKAARVKADTLQSIANEYFAREGSKLRSLAKRRATLERLVYPELGARPIGDVRRSDVVRLLDRIEDESGAATADQTLAFLRRVMSWHATRSDDFRSPIVRGMARTSPSEQARSRVLSDDELRTIWAAANTGQGPFPAFIQFLLLTGARRTEAAAMTRREIVGADWILPAARNKTKLDLVRPLSTAAQAVIDKLPRIGSGEFVFTIDGRRPISSYSTFKAQFDQQCGITGWTLHDLRRTARSLMSRAGVLTDHAERCLGHVIGGIRATYDRHEYHAEKQRAFEALATLIESIVNPKANVVPLKAR